MTNRSKVAMLLAEAREAGATDVDVADVLLQTAALLGVADDKSLTDTMLAEMVREGWLDKTPWRD